MGLTEKEKSRRYRERLKADPEKLAERNRKKRVSYHKNKKLISSMPPEDKENCRIIWKLRKQSQRNRQKAVRNIIENTPSSSPSILQEINPEDQLQPTTPPPTPAVSSKNEKIRGRKKVRRDRSKLYRENVKLQSESKKWKKKFEKYKKRAHRREKELIKVKEKREENIEEKQKYGILTNAIKDNYRKIKARNGKKMLKNIFAKLGAQKHKIVKDCLGLQGRLRTSNTRNSDTELTKKINSFFLRDDVSRNTAGKKETITKGKEKVQKRFLLDSMKHLFKAFKSENPNAKCSYFYFTKNRPFYVVTPTVDGRDMCLCKVHTNAAAKIKALKQKRVISALDLSTLISETICDSTKKECMFGTCNQCRDKEFKINSDSVRGKIQWFEWVREQEIYLKNDKKFKAVKNAKRLKEDTIENMVKNFQEELKSIKKHIFNMKTQFKNFRQCVDEIRANEAVILVDFSENYNCKCTEEIQAHQFGGSRNQVTLHTVVVYVYDKDKKYEALSFCTISPCNIHQPAAIWAHLHPILIKIIENYPGIDTIHYFSDGPFSQYRQKANFYLACTKTFSYGFQAFSWSFFEAGHGKGPADGIGGFLKRAADKKVATGTDVTDALQFYEVLKESSKIQLFYVTKEEIDGIQRDIPKNLLPLPGTKEVHQIFSKSYGQLMSRNLSCFCSRGLCECLRPKLYSPIPALRNIPTPVDPDEDIPQEMPLSPILAPLENIYNDTFSDVDDVPLNNLLSSNKDNITFAEIHEGLRKSIYKSVYGSSDSSDNENDTTEEPQPSTSGQKNLLPGVGDFLLVKVYSTKGKSYDTYACIAETDIDEDGEIRVTFLKCVKNGKLFILNKKDKSYVAFNDIIKKLPTPDIEHKRGTEYYKFSCDINVFRK
ncbi:unnamed protein product, partial [Brenthis ino]